MNGIKIGEMVIGYIDGEEVVRGTLIDITYPKTYSHPYCIYGIGETGSVDEVGYCVQKIEVWDKG